VLRLTSPMMRGADVAQWQAAIKATPDGLFGPATRQATIVWQGSKGLTADGIVGPRSWQAAGF
jgi:peptidoglycan hydrolase-like protein with peptidoglycan-binding domain